MWRRAIVKAVERGAIKTPYTFHDLRAKTASDHPDIQKAADLLGHENVQMTKSVYDRSERIVDPLE
jgi:integrase